MASSRDTSNGPDWKDIAAALQAFQSQEELDLTVILRAVGTENRPDLEVEVQARPKLIWKQEAAPWDYVKLTCSATQRKTLEAALLAALYQLDFRIASRSVPGKGKPKA